MKDKLINSIPKIITITGLSFLVLVAISACKNSQKIERDKMHRINIAMEEMRKMELQKAFMLGENKQIERCNKILESLR